MLDVKSLLFTLNKVSDSLVFSVKIPAKSSKNSSAIKPGATQNAIFIKMTKVWENSAKNSACRSIKHSKFNVAWNLWHIPDKNCSIFFQFARTLKLIFCPIRNQGEEHRISRSLKGVNNWKRCGFPIWAMMTTPLKKSLQT